MTIQRSYSKWAYYLHFILFCAHVTGKNLESLGDHIQIIPAIWFWRHNFEYNEFESHLGLCKVYKTSDYKTNLNCDQLFANIFVFMWQKIAASTIVFDYCFSVKNQFSNNFEKCCRVDNS